MDKEFLWYKIGEDDKNRQDGLLDEKLVDIAKRGSDDSLHLGMYSM